MRFRIWHAIAESFVPLFSNVSQLIAALFFFVWFSLFPLDPLHSSFLPGRGPEQSFVQSLLYLVPRD